IERNTTIYATWIANSNTKYKVEYYLQNLQNNDYYLEAVADKEGTTDTVVYAEIRTFNHFTPTSQTVSGNVKSNGSTVLKVYYNRNKYSLEATNGTVTNSGSHKYGKEITTIATPHLGYEFVGWYCGEDMLSENITFSFKVEKNIVAKFTIKEEMSNFNFDATTTTCIINGIKDKTLTEIMVPEYVTSISGGAFSGCSSLKNITIPFIGDVADKTGDYSKLPFGYIFGTKNYVGAEEIEQLYYYTSSSTTRSTYFIPASLETVTITKGDIFFGAFNNCSQLTSILIKEGITRIGTMPFNGCTSLASIVIPKSVTTIDFAVFHNRYDFPLLNAVYYGGSEIDWERISFNNANSLLKTVTRYYYIESESKLPADNGNYWHYDENGNVVIW
ncbi:MAG: leucine-rich repeat domain-containing protein, partial [Clostridia bacterium]|nr:leucine-rich repeat domain-containing protein [Clostridia bacterium]